MVFPYQVFYSFDKPEIDGDFSEFEITGENLPEGIHLDSTDGHFYGNATEITSTFQLYAIKINNPRTPLIFNVEIKTESKKNKFKFRVILFRRNRRRFYL